MRGQIAVAQVVMNRTFSGFYPTTVCGVVYQNKHRHYACQFTFACDNVADVVREPDMWDRAKKIAKAMLDGQLWLPEVGEVDALPRLLGAPVLGQRNEEDVQVRRAHLLPPARLGRRQRRAELGIAEADRGDLSGARRGGQELGGDVRRRRCGGRSSPKLSESGLSTLHASISSATSKFGAECVSAPAEA